MLNKHISGFLIMNQQSEDSTQRYYEERAEEYLARTANVDMGSVYEPFLAHIPSGGRILDAGCGPGRDALAFLKKGFHVTAFDASLKMAEIASHQTGLVVDQMRFQDLSYDSEFDGIWACASLLHVSSTEIDNVLLKLSHALKPGGFWYMSFKEGYGERVEDGRRFLDFTEASLKTRLGSIPGISIIRIWSCEDQAGRVGIRWVNALVRREA